MYDVIIVGAGPAGMFSAYELITKNSNLKVAIFEKGKKVVDRQCPMAKTGKCFNCNPCQILSGYGGAGTFSDGKLNFIAKLGKSDLYKYMPQHSADDLINETESIFTKFGMDAEIYPKETQKALEIQKDVAKKGAKLLIIKQKHLGSDKLPGHINNLANYLTKCGVELYDDYDVIDIVAEKRDEIKVTYKDLRTNEEKEVYSHNVIVAPGRTGAGWLQMLAEKHNFKYTSQSIEVGVRVEVRKEIMEDICKEIYDPTIFIKTNTFDDQIRTFCTNPGGFVAKENYYGFICVNGHALKDIKSANTNFAFISKINLTYPATNTRLYGESIARIANLLGDNKPTIQKLGDLRDGRRSDWKKINDGLIEPTLKDVVAGDLALMLPHRIIINILEGLEVLDKIIPGVNNNETLLYGPEIKFFSNEIETNNQFKTENANIYFVGDGAGKAGNIVAAAATGLIASRDILNRT